MLFEDAAVLHGDGGAGIVLDAAQGYAHVFGFNDHDDIGGVEGTLEGDQDLFGHALLHLRAAGKIIYDAVELGQPDHLTGGDVANVGPAQDGEEVVFAGGFDGDVFLNQHAAVLVRILERRDSGQIGRVQALKNFLDEHFGDAAGRIAQAVVAEVEAQGVEDIGEGVGNAAHFFGIAEVEGIGAQGRFKAAARVVVAHFFGVVAKRLFNRVGIFDHFLWHLEGTFYGQLTAGWPGLEQVAGDVNKKLGRRLCLGAKLKQGVAARPARGGAGAGLAFLLTRGKPQKR